MVTYLISTTRVHAAVLQEWIRILDVLHRLTEVGICAWFYPSAIKIWACLICDDRALSGKFIQDRSRLQFIMKTCLCNNTIYRNIQIIRKLKKMLTFYFFFCFCSRPKCWQAMVKWNWQFTVSRFPLILDLLLQYTKP